MSFTGEINQHLQGNRANVSRVFSTLKLLEGIDSSSKTTGTLIVNGGLGLSGNLFCNGLTIANSTESILYLNTTAVSGSAVLSFQINGNSQLSIGYTTGAGISINDLANGGSWLYQSGAIAGYVRSVNNILDDGSGGVSLATANATPVNIGTGTYTGQVTIGNTSNNLSPLIQGGILSNAALNVNNTSVNGCYIYIKSSLNSKVAFGYSGPSKPIDIYDFGATSSWLYNNGTHGFVGSAHNTLDDGTGAATFAGTVTVNSSISTPLILQSATSGGCTISFLTASGGTNVGIFGYSSVSGLNLTNGAGAYVFRQAGGSNTEKSLHSNNNILDDGAGNMTIVGTGDPILSLRRSSYSSNFISRFRFVDNNTSGKYWEIGTDVGGSQGGDLYFYGQGSGGLGLAMQLTSKGALYLGYGAPQIKTTESTLAAGNQTVTAAQMLGYFIFSPSQTSNFIWTFDTGANIYSAMGSPPVGTTVPFLLTNGTSFACVFAFGTGVTNKLRVGSITNSTLMCYARVTGTNTIDLISQ